MTMPAVSTRANIGYLFNSDTIPQDVVDKVARISNGIYSRNKSGRSLEEISIKVLRGIASEVAFTSMFPQFVNHDAFEYDVASLTSIKGTRIEIKCPLKDKNWWVPRNYENFYNSARNGTVDFICNTYIEEETGVFFIKAIANAGTFENYLRQGPYNEYYNHHEAIKDGECWVGSNVIDRINQIIEDNRWEHF